MNTTLQAISALRSTRFNARAGASLSTIFAALVLALGLAASVQAQIVATGEISGTPIGGGAYDYSITLHNAPASLNGIQTFWYSWVPGSDFLPTPPLTVTPPAGWSYYVNGGPYYYPDGYSIEFYNSSTALNPGSSLNFHFTSTDSPTVLAGNSSIFPTYPIGTSWVYSNVGYGNSLQFVVQSVPEPGSISLLVAGSLACLWPVRRSRSGR